MTISVLLNSQNSDGEIEFPNEPGTSRGDYHYIVDAGDGSYQLRYSRWSVIWFAEGSADTYLNTSQAVFWDKATWSQDRSACGIYDPQGLSLTEDPFKGNLDGDKIIQAWMDAIDLYPRHFFVVFKISLFRHELQQSINNGNQDQHGSLVKTVSMFTTALKSIAGVSEVTETIGEISTKDLIDADGMYWKKRYAFEICTEKYRFRVFPC